MSMALSKKFMWMIVLWFAVLQTVTPFIHAHLEADAPDQKHGLHMHEQRVLQVSAIDAMTDSVSAPPVHTVGVNEAVVKHADLLPLPLFALLFVMSLLPIVTRLTRYHLSQPHLQSLHLRSLSRPRAPPLF